MQPFHIVSGPAAPLPLDDINTDQIIPSAWLRKMDADLGEGLLAYMRRHPDGSTNEDFVLERPQFRDARILVVGENFGCGSSREHAAWALLAFGVRCVVARSHAEFFRENSLKNGILPITLEGEPMDELLHRVVTTDGRDPFTVDLEAQEIRGSGEYAQRFEIAPHERTALLEGLDDVGLTLKHAYDIATWERRTTQERPFLQSLNLDAGRRQS